MISARTALVTLLGYPARYSLSPAMHNAAYTAIGFDGVFVVTPVAPDAIADAVTAMRAMSIAGAAVTVPHKQTVMGLVDELDPSATDAGAVNWIANHDGRLVGHSTDGIGFMRSVAGAGIDWSDRSVVVLGAGGAAHSIAAALRDHDIADVRVAARRPEAATELAERFGCRPVPLESACGADVIINCTTVGMSGGGAETESPVPVETLHAGHTVIDIVYAPERTPLLSAATAVGATTLGGLPMLAEQAAEQVRLLTGISPPVEGMLSAARHEQSRPATGH